MTLVIVGCGLSWVYERAAGKFFFSPLVISGVFVMTLKKRMNKWVSPPKFFIHYIVDQGGLQTKHSLNLSSLILWSPLPSPLSDMQVALRIIPYQWSCSSCVDHNCLLESVKKACLIFAIFVSTWPKSWYQVVNCISCLCYKADCLFRYLVTAASMLW